MRLLFVHQNFPAQFKFLSAVFAAMSEVRVVALSMRAGPDISGILSVTHQPEQELTPSLLPFVSDFESKMLRAHSAVRAAHKLEAEGFTPDVIIGHPGWGETLFLEEVWPKSRQLHFLEFFYHTHESDVDFDPEFRSDALENRLRVLSKQAAPLWALQQMNWGLSPTKWQRTTYPEREWPRISTIHDGIDTQSLKPRSGLELTLQNKGLVLKSGDPIITFVNRNLEPYRGYHIFMRALPKILEKHPSAQVLIVGGEGVSYGAPPPPDKPSWKSLFYDEVVDRIDAERVHFLGNVPYQTFISLLQISAVHVYLTYPFVLSWSLLEAMACECLIIGSRTAPVMEAIENGKTGLLVDFFDIEALAAMVLDTLDRPDSYRSIRRAARQKIIETYDLKNVCLPAQIDLVRKVFAMPRA